MKGVEFSNEEISKIIKYDLIVGISSNSFLEKLGEYISNEDNEIVYDGTLLNKVGITLEEIKTNISFDLTIKTSVGRILTIIDPTHIMTDKKNIYEIIGSVNFKDIYDQYYVETESATLTIIDSLNGKTIANIIYDKGKKLEKLTIDDLGLDYESFLTNRYLYEDELLTNKLTSLTMDADKTVYLGLIERKLDISCDEMTVEEAKDQGAIGLFESKYGEKVKVYTMGDVSKEICGGPHAKNTADLHHFKITKEESSSSGIRRIKAILD
mgnify:CR=1 FL=1